MERTRSPELTAQQQAERALMEENVEDLRNRQVDILHDHTLSDDEKRLCIDEVVHTYLGDYNVQRDDDQYDEYYSIVRSLSVDTTTHIQWLHGNWDRESQTTSGKTGYDKLHDAQERLFGRRLDFGSIDAHSLDVVDNDPVDPEQVSLSELETSANNLREEWAKANAKRGSKLFGSKKSDDTELEARYNRAVQALGNAKLHDVLHDDSKSMEEKNAAVVAFLFAEQELLRTQTTTELNNTHVGKWVELMNRGNKWQRFGKAALLGAAFGFGGAIIAGVVGTGLAAGGAVAVGKFVRGYTAHDKRGVKAANEHFDESAVVEAMTEEQATLGDEREHRFVSATRHMNYLYEDETKDQQKKRRKAFAWGVGGVAAGSALAYTGFFGISQAVKEATSYDLQLLHPLGEYNLDIIDNKGDVDISDDWSHGDSPNLDANPGGWDGYDAPDVDIDGDSNTGGVDPNEGGTEPGGHHPQPEHPATPQHNGDHADLVGDTNDNSNVFTADAGHGLTHEWMDFAEANDQHLTPEQAYNMHLAMVEEFGPDYINLDGPGPDVYYEGDDIRITRPTEGHWEEGVPEFAVQYMHTNGLWHKAA